MVRRLLAFILSILLYFNELILKEVAGKKPAVKQTKLRSNCEDIDNMKSLDNMGVNIKFLEAIAENIKSLEAIAET